MAMDVLTQIDELHAIAKELESKNLDDEGMIAELMTHGIDAAYAGMIIDNIRKDSRDRKDSYKLLFMGIFLVVGGLLATYFSYQLAQGTSTFFFIFWGLPVSGIITILKAISLYRK